jgi:hypothetical protein
MKTNNIRISLPRKNQEFWNKDAKRQPKTSEKKIYNRNNAENGFLKPHPGLDDGFLNL